VAQVIRGAAKAVAMEEEYSTKITDVVKALGEECNVINLKIMK
jgi:hypothetical protein